ncbi:MAG: serine--tRNA ligase, partial [Sphingomonadales bacterium]|nr:serine--tRNA ligase [Sphingomonadales bacterium]
MFDIKIIRENPADFDKGLARRGLEPLSAELIALDAERRAIVTDLSNWQARRNEVSRGIGKIKSQGGDADALMAEVAELKKNIADGEAKERDVSEQLKGRLMAIPNLPHDSTPDGADEDDNVIVRTEGDVPELGFEAKEHFDLGADLGQMDFETAAKLSGSRFVLLKGQLARLERALGQFMLDLHTTEHDYAEVQTPVLVKSDALFGTGQLPKFEE